MKLIQELNNYGSTIDKQRLLSKTQDDEQQLLHYTYHPDWVYGVKFKDDEIDMDSINEPTSQLFTLLDHLRLKEITGKFARECVEYHAELHGDLIKLVCNKDLRCGVSSTTINKAIPGLIPVFKVQLAKEVPVDSLKYPLFAQLKYDGVRIVILWDTYSVIFKTRNGKVIHLPKISRMLKNSFKHLGPVMLDSEVTLFHGTVADRAKVSGMINSARSKNPIDESKLIFNVFDAMPLDNFNSAKCTLKYTDRLTLAELYTKTSTWLCRAETHYISYPDQTNKLFEKVLAKNLEGLILKQFDHLYTFKRSKDWAKLKDVKTADLLCTGIQEGTGKYQGMIGALVCEGDVEGKQVTVNIGSGLTDYNRGEHPSEYIGSTIEVKYNSIIKDSTTNEWSLFLPRYVCTRFDK